MNNYYVLKHLAAFLQDRIDNSSYLFSYSPHKDVWELYIETAPSQQQRLIFSTNPSETAIFLDNSRPPKKSNATTFFDQLNEDKLIKISLNDNDRFLTVLFQSGRELLFLPFGNHPNVFLIDNDEISEAFKQNSSHSGKTPPVPRVPKKKTADLQDNSSPRKTILAHFPKFPRHLIDPLINHLGLEDLSAEDVADAIKTVVASMENNPCFRILEDGNLCLIPENILPLPTRKEFNNVNDAIKYAYYRTSSERRLSGKISSLRPKIVQSIKKHKAAVSQLSEADKGLERAEDYKKFGHILMANAHESLPLEDGTVEVSDLYNHNKPVRIPVKPSLSVAENAQRYYNKSSKAVRNVEESERRLKVMKKELTDLTRLLESLDSLNKVYEFDDWYSSHEHSLKKLGILSKIQDEPSLPYRKTEVDGYEVWIGKNAKSNDEVTTRAHKEDIWLHARGVSGSHVVIRMENNKNMPSKAVIRKAAAAAAWNSKARGSQLVPVIFTKRKYVTKPKGAPAGTVRVQREEVEMVEPHKLS
jgi:predicted ribosome quality control (RQC) complex YloA/Tae2 family protein